MNERERYLQRLTRWADDTVGLLEPGRGDLARDAGWELARRLGAVVPPHVHHDEGHRGLHLPDPPDDADPCLPGEAWARLRPRAERQHRGAVATPPDLARRVVELALSRHGCAPRSVWDPAVGGGVFLVAAAEALVARGVEPDLVLPRLHGTDTDPVAVAFADCAMRTWAERYGATTAARLDVADALLTAPAAVDVIVGNPPFRGQLGRRTRHDPDERAIARQLLGEAAGYADTAGLFLARAATSLAPGGVAAMVQPQSLLAARDSAAVRSHVLESTGLVALWVIDAPVFTAAVHACVCVVRRGDQAASTDLHAGRDAIRVGRASRPSGSEPWSGLAATTRAVPEVPLGGEPTRLLGDVAEITADFRDAFYDVAAHVGEPPVGRHAPHLARVVTAGLIDPARLEWGRRPARLGGRRWECPMVDVSRLGEWAERRRVPKVLVASQTRVIEAVADPDGDLLPVTPVVTVSTSAERCWHLLAALSDPWATAWVLREAGGTARSPDALKVSAPLLRRLPLPEEGEEWDAAAAALRLGEGVEAAAVPMLAARGLEGSEADRMLEWWRDRLPRAVRSSTEQVPRPIP